MRTREPSGQTCGPKGQTANRLAAERLMAERSKPFIALMTEPNTAVATAVLLGELHEKTGDRTFLHLARRVLGEAGRPGSDEIDDREKLAEVRALRERGFARDAVGMVARKHERYDEAAQSSLAHRLRRKLKE